jgi:hypothetical protein
MEVVEGNMYDGFSKTKWLLPYFLGTPYHNQKGLSLEMGFEESVKPFLVRFACTYKCWTACELLWRSTQFLDSQKWAVFNRAQFLAYDEECFSAHCLADIMLFQNKLSFLKPWSSDCQASIIPTSFGHSAYSRPCHCRFPLSCNKSVIPSCPCQT